MMRIPAWRHIAVEIADGIAHATLHDGQGGAMRWCAATHREVTELFAWIAVDGSVKVLVLTGAGDRFCTEIDSTELRTMTWRSIWSEGQRMLNGYLATDAIVIGVANGPAFVHAELLLMADIVLGCPEASFADHAHFTRNVPPGDGAHTVWSHRLGPSRAGYHHLTGAIIDADEARRLGMLHEILPRDELMARATALAGEIAARPAPIIAYTKAVLRLEERRHFAETLSHGMAMQGMAMYATGMRQKDEA